MFQYTPMRLGCAAVAALLLAGCTGRDGNALSASGTIEGTEVAVSAEAGGKLQTIRVQEGALVNTGDTLAVIDDAEYRLQLRQAVANFEAAEAQYRLVVEGPRKEDVVQAEAAYHNAETDYQRMKELVAAKSASQKQYDDAYARFVVAQQAFEKLSKGSRRDEILMARARRDQASAQADQLKKRVRDCTIVAPSSGTVTLRAAEPGELAAAGATLFHLTALDLVKLTVYLNEAELGKISLGQKAEVKIDAYADRSFNGTIIYISPTAEFTPKNVQTKEERTKLVFAVRIEIENPEHILKPGLPADATLIPR